jgi:Helix-turn-helix
MPTDLQFKAALKKWFAGQSKYKNLHEAADGIGVSFNTLRGYFSGKRPSDKNLKVLIVATGVELSLVHQPAKSNRPNLKNRIYATRLLDELQYDLARCLVSFPAIQAILNEGVPREKQSAPRKAQQIQSLMDALQENLGAIVNDPEALQLLRKTVSGSDAGYLSGLLGALFDDRRLQTWRQMTSYKYGSK